MVQGDILDIFEERTGLRINVMVERLYMHNVENRATLQKYHSTLLEVDIPILEYDPILDFFIDLLWSEFILKKLLVVPEVVRRTNQATKNIKDLFDLMLELPESNRPTWFAKCIQRECADDGFSEDHLEIAAIKCIATMSDTFVETSLKKLKKSKKLIHI